MDKNELKQRIIVNTSSIIVLKNFFDWYHRRRMRPAREMLQTDGIRVCHDVCKSLNDRGIEAFPVFGSLLGLVRDGAFMMHDDDIDIGIIAKNSFSWDEVKCSMESIGLAQYREFGFDGKVTEQAYRYKNCLGVDLFNLYPIDDNKLEVFFYTYKNSANKNRLSIKVQEIPRPKTINIKNFHDHTVPIPDCSEEILSCHYGSGWKIPDPTWQSTGINFKFLDGSEPFIRYYA